MVNVASVEFQVEKCCKRFIIFDTGTNFKQLVLIVIKCVFHFL